MNNIGISEEPGALASVLFCVAIDISADSVIINTYLLY